MFSVTLSLLLVEALLFEFWKIPFTCSYPPGKANVTLLWIFYWVGFTTYAYSMATLEVWMVRRPVRLLWFYAAAAALWGWFQWQRRRWDRVGTTLVFEDAAGPGGADAGAERNRVVAQSSASARRSENVKDQKSCGSAPPDNPGRQGIVYVPDNAGRSVTPHGRGPTFCDRRRKSIVR